MSIRQRGTSYQASFSHQGKRYRKDFPTKAEAQAWEAQVRSAVLNGQDPAPRTAKRGGVTTLKDMLDIVQVRYWNHAKSGKNLTYNGAEVIEILGPDTPVSRVSTAAVRELVNHYRKKGKTGATINRKLAALSKLLTVAEREDIIIKRPHIEYLKESEGRLEWWTQEMERQALAYCRMTERQDLEDFIILGLDTGLRMGELLRIEARDIDWNQNLLMVWTSKTDKPRSVPMTQRVRDILTRRTEDRGNAFGGITRHMITHWWDTMKEHIDIPGLGSPHTLRHTFCSRLVQRGVPLATIQALAGHSSITTTLRYAKLAPANLKDAIGVLEAAGT
jgi:integrase